MKGNSDQSALGLTEEEWDLVYRQTRAYFRKLINSHRWRRAHDGILPNLNDADDITAAAIAQVLSEAQEHPDAAPHGFFPVKCKLRHNGRNNLDCLRHRSENHRVVNIPDLFPLFTDDGEAVNPVHNLPDPGSHPLAQLMDREENAIAEGVLNCFRACLGQNHRLVRLLDLRWDGLLHPQALARELKLSVRTIENLQKQLIRRWTEFLRLQFSAENGKKIKKLHSDSP